MTTAIDVINVALQHIGAHSPINPAPAETIEAALGRLVEVIRETRGEDFDMGADIPTVPASELNENEGARMALEYLLVAKVASITRKPIPFEVSKEADKSIRLARERWQYGIPPLRKRTPLQGQGNATRVT